MKKVLKFTIYLLLVLLVIFICGLFWLYSGSLNQNKIAILEKFPFPLATVNKTPVLVQDYFLRYKVTKALYNKSNIKFDEKQLKNSVYNQLILETKVNLIAAEKNIHISDSEIDSEYNFRANNSDKEGFLDFESLVKSYGLTVKQYKDFIIKPYLTSESLKIWFNSQEPLNSKQFSLSKSLIDRINANEDMGNLAREYTQDPNGKDTKGDMGFIDPNLLLKEVGFEIAKMQIGEAKIIYSRLGIHIIKLEEKMDNKVRLREIFLKTEDFNTWLNNEFINFTTKKLLPI